MTHPSDAVTPQMLDCESVMRQLWDYLDGELTPDREVAVRRHLAACARCHPQFDFERAFLDALAATRREHSRPDALRDAVRSALRAANESTPSRESPHGADALGEPGAELASSEDSAFDTSSSSVPSSSTGGRMIDGDDPERSIPGIAPRHVSGATVAHSISRDVDGILMRWEERGEGVPVVLVHGIPTSPRLWRHVVPRLCGVRTLAWEMVGYGDSIPQGEQRDISVAKQADYLLAWLDALGIRRAVLVGHDLGGGVVQIAAVRRPGLCAGLLLTNCIGYDSWPIPSVKLMRAAGPVTRHLPGAVAKHAVLGMLMRRGHDRQHMATESLDVHWMAYAAHGGAAALLRQMRALDVRDTLRVAPDLPRLRGVPAHVIWGAADQFQKVEYGERLARDLGTSLQRIEGGKHFTPEDHPDVIADGILALSRRASV